jgi:hypothetical protein
VNGPQRFLDPPALLYNKLFLLPGQIADAFPYFRPPLEPRGIDVCNIIPLAPPADLTVSADARQRRRPTPINAFMVSRKWGPDSLVKDHVAQALAYYFENEPARQPSC